MYYFVIVRILFTNATAVFHAVATVVRDASVKRAGDALERTCVLCKSSARELHLSRGYLEHRVWIEMKSIDCFDHGLYVFFPEVFGALHRRLRMYRRQRLSAQFQARFFAIGRSRKWHYVDGFSYNACSDTRNTKNVFQPVYLMTE